MLNLPELAKLGQQNKSVLIDKRLPAFLPFPCHLNAIFHVEAKDDFYLIHLQATGNLIITCQRCMDDFNFSYDNNTVIAVCSSDERAEQLIEQYECIVSSNWQVDLEEIIIDELHLYAPIFHPQLNDCNSEINQFLTGKNETY